MWKCSSKLIHRFADSPRLFAYTGCESLNGLIPEYHVYRQYREREIKEEKKSNEKYLTTWLNANTCRAMRATNKYAASLSSFSTGRMWWDLHLLEHFYQTETIHTKIAFHHQITKIGRFLHAVINDLRFTPELIIKHEPVFRISATKVNVRQSIFPIHFNYFRELCACFSIHLFFFVAS